jgi:hypothetical protein
VTYDSRSNLIADTRLMKDRTKQECGETPFVIAASLAPAVGLGRVFPYVWGSLSTFALGNQANSATAQAEVFTAVCWLSRVDGTRSSPSRLREKIFRSCCGVASVKVDLVCVNLVHNTP